MNIVKNNVIYKENDQADYLYFIRKGEIELSKYIEVENNEAEIIDKSEVLNKVQITKK